MANINPIQIIFFSTAILLNGFQNLSGQNLKNTEWIKIKSERKDGSRIIERNPSVDAILVGAPVKLTFGDSTLLISYDGERTEHYRVNNKTITTGIIINKQFFTTNIFYIDSLTKAIMIISEIPQKETSDDKLNRFLYVKNNYYLQYLISRKEISISGDSLVHCNKLLFPYFSSDNIDRYLTRNLLPTKIGELMVGNIIFLPNGRIEKLNIEKTENLSEQRILKFKNALLSTSGKWRFPIDGGGYHFKMDFAISSYSIVSSKNYGVPSPIIKMVYNINDNSQLNAPVLSIEKFTQAGILYNKAVKLLYKNKYAESIEKFDECLKIDSMHIDAYYNKAHAHMKLNEGKLACESWKKLIELGQKQAEVLYKNNCRY